jgi:amicyanin
VPPLTPSPARGATAVIAIGVCAVALTACGGRSGASTSAGSDQPRIAATSGGPTTTMDMPMPTSTAPSEPAAATNAVSITNFAFSPAAITVKVGTAVTWTNQDEEPHTVFSDAGGMKSPVLASNQNTFTFTFTKPGTYSYNCTIHPFMHGNVTVTA